MRTVGYLWESLASFENLHAAYLKARRAKRYSRSAAEFSIDLDENLLALRDELRLRTWEPGPYRTFTIYMPKQRLISAAPFRDRVVHHALCAIIEPVFERTFIADSYATRKGKGSHAAVERFTQFQRRFRFVLTLDVEKYFPSIDHSILRGLLRRRIVCPDTLALADLIIDRSNLQEPRNIMFAGDSPGEGVDRRRGLPIGNLTSQFFANVYLDPIDHFVKEVLRCRGYIRYMDDLCLFSDSKEELWEWLEALRGRLATLRLLPKAAKTRVFSTKENIGFLGYRCLRSCRRLERGNVVRAMRRLHANWRAVKAGGMDERAFRSSLMAWYGHAAKADSKTLLLDLVPRSMFESVRKERNPGLQG